MHSYTLNEVFHMAAIRASKKSALGASKFAALRAMHFPDKKTKRDFLGSRATFLVWLAPCISFLHTSQDSGALDLGIKALQDNLQSVRIAATNWILWHFWARNLVAN